MRVIDTDAGLLREYADAAVHAAEQTRLHIESEIGGRVPEIVETLRAEGPYAYTIMPHVRPDGSVGLPILSTRDEIRDAYTMIRGASDLLSVEPLVEIRGSWYTFQEAISIGQRKGSGTASENMTLGLFPVSTDKGITGELVWVVLPRGQLGAGPAAGDETKGHWQLRREVLTLHDRYIQALRDADVDEIVDGLNDGVASAVRDYVDDTGKLVSLEGEDAHRSYYQSFFGKYTVRSVELLDRVVQDSYAFAELRFTVTPADNRSATLAFHTAEFHVVAGDGRFIARVGHGSDPR
jgi:SnoaL-like domain